MKKFKKRKTIPHTWGQFWTMVFIGAFAIIGFCYTISLIVDLIISL